MHTALKMKWVKKIFLIFELNKKKESFQLLL